MRMLKMKKRSDCQIFYSNSLFGGAPVLLSLLFFPIFRKSSKRLLCMYVYTAMITKKNTLSQNEETEKNDDFLN
jgi:hypothetical protein